MLHHFDDNFMPRFAWIMALKRALEDAVKFAPLESLLLFRKKKWDPCLG